MDALEQYVADGGGVFFVAGPQTSGEFVNQALYRQGKGMFPVPLAGPQSLAVDPLDNTPDVQSEDHPCFSRHRQPRRLSVEDLYQAILCGRPELECHRRQGRSRHHAAAQQGAALLVEKNFGRGRVMALLTTTSNKWNNWGVSDQQGYVYFVFVRNMVAYLSRRANADAGLQVGEPKVNHLSGHQVCTGGPFRRAGRRVDFSYHRSRARRQGQFEGHLARTTTSGFYTA